MHEGTWGGGKVKSGVQRDKWESMSTCWLLATGKGRSHTVRATQCVGGPGRNAIMKYKSKQVKGASFKNGERVEGENGAGKTQKVALRGKKLHVWGRKTRDAKMQQPVRGV